MLINDTYKYCPRMTGWKTSVNEQNAKKQHTKGMQRNYIEINATKLTNITEITLRPMPVSPASRLSLKCSF